MSTPETRPRNFANYTLTISASALLGPLIGGFSIDRSDHATTCLYLALLTVAPLAILMTKGSLLPGGTHTAAKAGGGVRTMLADPVVRRLLATGSLLNAGISMYQVYLPVYAHSIGLSASTIGLILATHAAATFTVRFGLPRLIERLGEARLLMYAFYVGAATLALLPFFHSALLLAMISFVFGLGMGCGQPIVIMLMFVNAREGRSGESLGLKITANQLTKMVAPVLFGAVAAVTGLLPLFWIDAAMMAAGGIMSRVRKG
jgi:predicted MFS family arabinose efflux permease